MIKDALREAAERMQTAIELLEEDLLFLKKLIEDGKLKPVIDRCFGLDEVPDAHRYVESGGKKGNVCITMDPGELN